MNFLDKKLEEGANLVRSKDDNRFKKLENALARVQEVLQEKDTEIQQL